MIRYPIPFARIEEMVDGKKANWRRRATERTKLFAELGGYTNKQVVAGKEKALSDFWGEIKSVFVGLQFGKCIFCETPLEAGENTEIQWDLEHFRPKGNVRAWTPPKSADHNLPIGEPLEKGYFLLAYHLGNYAAACKTCNSPYKSDYFPIAAARVIGKYTPEEYASEQAYLIYSLGDRAEDPEECITFYGHIAQPRNDSRRGRVMIDFFGLNRDGLRAARARWLRDTVWNVLRFALAGDEYSQTTLIKLLTPRSPFANCTRRFVELYQQDVAAAEDLIPVLEEVIQNFPDPHPL